MTTLNYDNQGFIVGISRMSRGIDNVHDDTQELIQILKSQNQIANTKLSELTRAVQNASRLGAQNNDRNRSTQNNGAPDSPLSEDTPQDRARNRRANINARRASRTSGSNNPANNSNNERRRTGRPTISRTSDNAADRARSRRTPTNPNGGSNNPARERDANGRFAGSSQSASQAALGRMMAGFKGVTGTGNVGGVDPVLDSLKEAKDLLSPLGRAAKLGGRAAKFSFSKLKAMKRREPLPIDQDRHNRENEKLLDKIWKAIRKTSERGGGLLGGLLGGAGGRGGGRRGRGALGRLRDLGGRGLRAVGGIKGLGIAGAVAGAASLGMDWKGLNKEEKTERIGQAGGGAAGALIGGTIGSVVPVVGTAIGAVVGGYLGAKGGELLGSAVSPHIQSWTAAITDYNLPKKMEVTWSNGIKPFFSRMGGLASKMAAWIDKQVTDMGEATSGAGAGLSEALGMSGLGSVAEKYESGGRGIGTVSTGAGDHGGVSYGTHQLSSKTGTMAAFLKSPDGQKFAGEFAGLKAGSAAFNSKYKDVANRRGDEFKKSQQDYITRTHYMPAKQIAEGYGFDTKNRGIQEAIYSHSTQYGGNHKSRFKRIAESGVDMKDNQAVLKAFYADKAAYVNKDFSSSSASVKASVAKRIKAESADVLAISKVSEVKNTVKDVVGTVADKAKDAIKPKKQPSTKKNGVPATPKESAGYKGGILGDDARSLINSTPVIPASKDALIFKSSLDVASGGESRSYANPTLPTKLSGKARAIASTSNSGYGAASFAPTPMLKIPAMPKVTQRLDSGSSDKPLFVQSSNDTINQNVSDRDLAHAITGGLGQSRQWA